TKEIEQEIIRPPQPPGLFKWMKDNLFNGILNSVLTLILFPVVSYLLYQIFIWVFFAADWQAVTQFPLLFAVGQYPREHIWRVGTIFSGMIFLLGVSWCRWGGLIRSIAFVAGIILIVFALLPVEHPELDMAMRIYLGSNLGLILLGYLIGNKTGLKNIFIIIAWLIVPILGIVILAGFENSTLIPAIPTTLWGGLMVTILLAAGGILLSFPLGVALAFGRRSSLPVVSAFSTVFIETIRGVPLITILFMFSIILALFLPMESRIDRLVRALMAVTVFSAAYSAENVRGGLQSVPLGQIEAAKALGMGGFKTTVFIVLPQALKAVLPAIVGQFIALFKDTTLVVIIGINDFLGIGRSIINSDPDFVQLRTEVYIFMAVIYWIFSYLMSLASRRIESAIGTESNL
ncbi:MAG: amino acid ABC transporter permease, partial [Anaerolineales bacterium]|nr:amino acid ABC transporter permease [Anaerolineales bacterium]